MKLTFIDANILPEHNKIVLIRGYGAKRKHYVYNFGYLKRTRTGYMWLDKYNDELMFKPVEYAELQYNINDEPIKNELNELKKTINDLDIKDIISVDIKNNYDYCYMSGEKTPMNISTTLTLTYR